MIVANAQKVEENLLEEIERYREQMNMDERDIELFRLSWYLSANSIIKGTNEQSNKRDRKISN